MKMLAIDPGTKVMGYAMFTDWRVIGPAGNMPERGWVLRSFGSINPPAAMEIEDRLKFILESLDMLIPVDIVVCESQPSSRMNPAPELGVIINRLRRWARRLGAQWEPVNTSTVTATMRKQIGNPPKGVKRAPADTRAEAVLAIYGLSVESVAQDVIDAVAVGRTYLVGNLS